MYRIIFLSVVVLALTQCGKSPSDNSQTFSGDGGSLSSDGNTAGGSNTGGNSGGSGDGGNDGGTIGGGNSGGGSDGGVISTIKPALAIRGTGCIMCHGRVEANVITDFGYGSPYYMGQGSGLHPLSGNIYGDHLPNWNTAKVWGNVYMPRAPLASPDLPGFNWLADFLRSQLVAPDAQSPVPTVIENASVYIGAPTAQRILQVAGILPTAHPKWSYLASSNGDIAGLELAPNGYVRNIPGTPINCSGDLIIDAVLLLNYLELNTNNGGCRIYATKSVFIQGPITYAGTFPDRNLQISSAEAILLGVGPGPIVQFDGSIASNHSLVLRFQQMWTVPGFFTRDTSATTTQKLDAIVAESLAIPELVDAASQPGGREVHYERLLLNTPNFQSRYQGDFKGVIIAELGLASLGAFKFHFDDVFSRVRPLPLLPESEILQVTP